MKSSQKLQDYLKSKETLRLKAYPDPKTGGDPWTIGYGATGADIKPGTVWTKEKAEQRFQDDLAQFEFMVNDTVKVPLTQGQFDALVSIYYNVGPGSKTRDGVVRLKDGRPSTLLRKLNEGDYVSARAEFGRWVSPGTNVERGLRIRRGEEVSEFWDAKANS